MRVFITGGTGSIGSNVVPALIRNGADVVALARQETSAARLEEMGATPVLGDCNEPEQWLDDASTCDVIIRASAVSFGRRSGSSWLAEAVRKTQVETSGLIQAATTGPSCRAFLYTSAFFTNGPQGESWVDEDAAAAPLLLAQIHRAGERLVSKAVSAGLAAFPLRVGFVYAPEGNFASFVLDEATKGRFKYIGDGDNYMPFVHIEDVVSAFVAGVQSPPVGQPVNVVDDQPLKMKSFVEQVVPHFGKNPGGIPRWLAFSLAGRPLRRNVQRFLSATKRSGERAPRMGTEILGRSRPPG